MTTILPQDHSPSSFLPGEVANWAIHRRRVLVLVDADQFFQPKHMQRCAELPPSFEVHFFSCSVYPSGAKKPIARHVDDFVAQAAQDGSRHQAYHWTTQNTTRDAADRVMISKARQLHTEEHPSVPFLYVTNDRALAKRMGELLVCREAVHWKHLHLRKREAKVTSC